ncbi:hypothetical protein ABZW03_32665 [Kitasatospora sp. NPDC004799]|uniref:hypothetical protein n=1 Tax=Kitasatospora sp. NPDC004799 TaxID=3154460 RepID=UPI0033BD2406
MKEHEAGAGTGPAESAEQVLTVEFEPAGKWGRVRASAPDSSRAHATARIVVIALAVAFLGREWRLALSARAA